VTFRRTGVADSHRNVVLSPGQRLRLEPDLITFEPSPPRNSVWRRWPFWAIAGAAVLAGVATVFVIDYYSPPPCPMGVRCPPP